jgi:hypothetical protein
MAISLAALAASSADASLSAHQLDLPNVRTALPLDFMNQTDDCTTIGGTTTRDRPSRSLPPRAYRENSQRARPVASRRRATDPSVRQHRHERR